MAVWRHLLFDAVTRKAQTELRAVGEGPAFADILNAPGTGSVTIPLDAPDASLTGAMLMPPRAIYGIEKDGVIVWSGPVLTHTMDFARRTITLGCEGWWNYVRRRYNVGNGLSFTNVEQTAIVGSLLDWLASWPNGDLQIDHSGLPVTGIIRTRVYNGFEHTSIGTLIEQLADVERGFDWKLDSRWTAGPNSSLGLVMRLTYPAVGSDAGYVLDLDANSATAGVKLDATNLSYVAMIEGEGTGQAQMLNITQNNTEMNAQGVRLESVESHTDVSTAQTLADYANRRLGQGRKSIIVPDVTVSTDLYGTIRVGQQVTIRALGLGLADQILANLAGGSATAYTYRVIEIDVDCGAEQMNLKLAPISSFAKYP